MKPQSTKIEQQIISGWVKQGASMLDLGCGDGELLALLIKEKQVRAQWQPNRNAMQKPIEG